MSSPVSHNCDLCVFRARSRRNLLPDGVLARHSSNFYAPDLAIDGTGNVFVTNYVNDSVSEWSVSNGAVTGNTEANGFNSSGTDEPWSLAVDGSGNVWVANLTSAGGSGSVTEFVGLGAPTVTPLVANLLSPYGSQAVNKP